MTWLRHATRHIHHTVLNHVKTELTGLDWLDPANTPFGAPAVNIIDSPVVDGDQIRKQFTAGTVACSVGGEFDPDPQELGGPLAQQEIPIFFDVFMDTAGSALACACDIRDILLGRIGGKRVLPVINQATSTPVAGWSIELTDVERAAPDQRYALHWAVVKATATVTYPEEVWG